MDTPRETSGSEASISPSASSKAFKSLEYRPYEISTAKANRKATYASKRSCDTCKLKKRKCDLEEMLESSSQNIYSSIENLKTSFLPVRCSACERLDIPCTLDILPKRRGPKPRNQGENESIMNLQVDTISSASSAFSLFRAGRGNASTSTGEKLPYSTEGGQILSASSSLPNQSPCLSEGSLPFFSNMLPVANNSPIITRPRSNSFDFTGIQDLSLTSSTLVQTTTRHPSFPASSHDQNQQSNPVFSQYLLDQQYAGSAATHHYPESSLTTSNHIHNNNSKSLPTIPLNHNSVLTLNPPAFSSNPQISQSQNQRPGDSINLNDKMMEWIQDSKLDNINADLLDVNQLQDGFDVDSSEFTLNHP